MRFQSPLVPARLERRYKRFLADAVLEESGARVTAHCANPGAMTGLAEPGMRIWLEHVAAPGRKLDWAWRLVELPGGHFAGIDSGRANAIVAEALAAGRVPGLEAPGAIRREQRYGERSRVDFVVETAEGPVLLEVKNVHLSRRPGLAEFPDTVTARGRRHMEELAAHVRAGARAMVLYLVQRTDCTRFRLAADIDPAYAAAAEAAQAAGVGVAALGTHIDPEQIIATGPLPVVAPGGPGR